MKKLILAIVLLFAACANPKVTELTCPDGDTLVSVQGQWQCQAFAAAVGPTGPVDASLPACAAGQVLGAGAGADGGWQCLALGPGLKVSDGALVSDDTCPPGYTIGNTALDTDAGYTVCAKAVSGADVPDEMVKVGDFWIDRYEISTCTGGLGNSDGYGTTAVGCSVAGVQPTTNITWFQAVQMCANAGKKLCTNGEWQAAASGTPDPGAWPETNDDACGTGSANTAAGQCNTCSGGARATGLGAISAGGNCASTWGAEDMIGNVWEWTEEWEQAGADSAFTPGAIATPWPEGFGDGADSTFNVNGSVKSTTWVNGLPAGVFRGGSYFDGSGAGAFAYLVLGPPSFGAPNDGARCCIGGR